jgi:serine/threonine protein kinase
VQETFGKYRLQRRLAHGGMAEVFLGTVHGEAGFSKTVVIKRLHPRLNQDDEFVQMLIDEARITSQLHHSNICQVLDLGSVSGSYYIAMEYIAGEDLRTLLDNFKRRGEFAPIDAALYILREVLEGLNYAHFREGADGEPLGVIHRDVSPQNILISYEGEVKVIDFGIAKAKSRLVHTQAGVIKGKFRYMSPEQASGMAVDHRTDVFAAGVVLYELLQGRPHSLDVPDTEVLRRMRDAEFEPISRSRSDVPDTLVRLVFKALQRKPRRRYANAGEFVKAIDAYLQKKSTKFGRAELAELMKSVFPLERRRERAGHSKADVSHPTTPLQQHTPSGTAMLEQDDAPASQRQTGAASRRNAAHSAAQRRADSATASQPRVMARRSPPQPITTARLRGAHSGEITQHKSVAEAAPAPAHALRDVSTAEQTTFRTGDFEASDYAAHLQGGPHGHAGHDPLRGVATAARRGQSRDVHAAAHGPPLDQAPPPAPPWSEAHGYTDDDPYADDGAYSYSESVQTSAHQTVDDEFPDLSYQARDPRSHATQAPDPRSHATQAPDPRSHATQAPDPRDLSCHAGT